MMWHRPGFVLGGGREAQLRVRNLSAGYGPILVLRDISLEVKPGLTVILGLVVFLAVTKTDETPSAEQAEPGGGAPPAGPRSPEMTV